MLVFAAYSFANHHRNPLALAPHAVYVWTSWPASECPGISSAKYSRRVLMKFVAQHADDLRGEGFVQHPDGLHRIEPVIVCHRAILHRLTRPLPDLFDMLEKAHNLSPSSRPACGALAPRGMPDTLSCVHQANY